MKKLALAVGVAGTAALTAGMLYNSGQQRGDDLEGTQNERRRLSGSRIADVALGTGLAIGTGSFCNIFFESKCWKRVKSWFVSEKKHDRFSNLPMPSASASQDNDPGSQLPADRSKYYEIQASIDSEEPMPYGIQWWNWKNLFGYAFIGAAVNFGSVFWGSGLSLFWATRRKTWNPIMKVSSLLCFNKKHIRHLAQTSHWQLRRHNQWERSDCMRDPWGPEFFVEKKSDGTHVVQGTDLLYGNTIVITREDKVPAVMLSKDDMERLARWVKRYRIWWVKNEFPGGPCGMVTLTFALFELGCLNVGDVTCYKDFHTLVSNIREVLRREQRQDPLTKRLESIYQDNLIGVLPSGITRAIRKQRLPCFKGLTAQVYLTKSCLNRYPVFTECHESWKYKVVDTIPMIEPWQRSLESSVSLTDEEKLAWWKLDQPQFDLDQLGNVIALG